MGARGIHVHLWRFYSIDQARGRGNGKCTWLVACNLKPVKRDGEQYL